MNRYTPTARSAPSPRSKAWNLSAGCVLYFVGNVFRRPHRYGLLISPEVEKASIRVNAGGEAYDRTKR